MVVLPATKIGPPESPLQVPPLEALLVKSTELPAFFSPNAASWLMVRSVA